MNAEQIEHAAQVLRDMYLADRTNDLEALLRVFDPRTQTVMAVAICAGLNAEYSTAFSEWLASNL
jgi:hypothetical protein